MAVGRQALSARFSNKRLRHPAMSAFFVKPQASAAVRIVNPNSVQETDGRSTSSPSPKKDSTQRQLCRNIIMHGSCQFQDKGCIYHHPQKEDSGPSLTTSRSDTAFTAAHAVNAPVFVPKTANPRSPPPLTRQASVATPPPTSPVYEQQEHIQEAHDPFGYPNLNGDSHLGEDMNHHMQAMEGPYYDDQHVEAYSSHPDLYYPGSFVRQPLDYHLYTAPLPEHFAATHFLPDDLREQLQQRSEAIRTAPMPGLGLPEDVTGYHSLAPLENASGTERRKFGNWFSTVYRAVKAVDGVTYVLRRIENFRGLANVNPFGPIEVWSGIRHSGIVSVREAFTTRAFGDNSLVVSYAYHPNAQTLYEKHLKPKPVGMFQYGPHQQTQNTSIAESTIWSYVVQIASAIKVIHDAGQAVRMVDPTKVLVTGKNCIRISSCGIVDVLTYDPSVPAINRQQEIALLQQEDLAMFGRLLLMVCCLSVGAGSNIGKALEIVGKIYSGELKNCVLWLLQKGAHKNIGQFLEMISAKVVCEMNEARAAVDRLEGELMGELENARLVRLLCKFGFINERPEFAREPRWSDTGDRYIVKLFRDFVFHSVDENGSPVVNLTHVLTCLNKLDAGTEERIMLVARDEQSCLVVSYKDIKACIESAFSELAQGPGVR